MRQQQAQQTAHVNANVDGSSRVTFEEPPSSRSAASSSAPPPYGEESSSTLALPVSRISDSSRSDGSLAEHGVYATTTTTHTVSTTTTFFRLPRRKKDKGPLFPLPPKVDSANTSTSATPRLSAGHSAESPTRQHFPGQAEQGTGNASPRRHLGFAIERSQSRASTRSGRPSSSMARGPTLEQRGRSSTMTSQGRVYEDDSVPTPPVPHSTRTSTSTAGRPSLAGLFNLTKLRQSSEPMFGRGSGPDTPGSVDSKQASLSLPREPPVPIPERQEGDTPAKYLARLEEVVNRGALVAIVSKSNDEFMKNVLRSFMRRFSFFEEPLDMATRKLLTQVQLPKETQQIDRTVQSFADRYHECNPGIFVSPDDAYFVAFSIIILHTDFFNSNNKRKMQKQDYVKNSTRKENSKEGNRSTVDSDAVPSEILECFYDNIVYTPFIHVEDEVEMTSERILAHKASRKGGLKASNSPSIRKGGSGPIDPYLLIFEGKLDNLRPPLQEVLSLEDPFNYLGTASSINVSDLNRCFFKYGVVQILSSRSRPDAFVNQATISNPAEAQVGIVDMKVTKVGIVWRKDPKKKKTRSPWQEWGAILTGSQLYFFRNTSWIKNLMHQFESHQKSRKSNTPVVFRPPLEQLKPDFLLSTDQVVALRDAEYRKHKHAFFVMRQTVYQEVFLADDESDMNDWLAKINYAATFRTAGVRMRGILAGSSESNTEHEGRQPESRSSAKSSLTSHSKTRRATNADEELTRQIMQARQQIMLQKIYEAREKIIEFEKILDDLVRTARHFCILTPIQARTREELMEATLQLATNIRWARVEKWRFRCHCDILQHDLNQDNKSSSEAPTSPSNKTELTPQQSKEKDIRSAFARFNSKNGNAASPNSSRIRPSNQPTGAKIFSMDDIFRSPSKTRQQAHKAKGSWELPPLSFERGRSVSLSRNSKTSSRRSSDLVTDQPIGNSNNDMVYAKPQTSRAASLIAESSGDKDEHEALVEAGVLVSESRRKERTKDPQEDGEEKVKIPDLEDKEGLSRVRHSLQRRLQNAHVPSHHRSKKGGRDSLVSNAISEDSTSTAESEGLARGSGSFTVNGKKASIVTFGSELQSIALEDWRVRRSPHDEDLKPPPMGFEPGEAPFPSSRSSSAGSRPSTADTASTVRSLGFVTPTEQVSSDSAPVSPHTRTTPERFDDDVHVNEEALAEEGTASA